MTKWKIHGHGKKSGGKFTLIENKQENVYLDINIIGTKTNLVFDYVEEIEE